ncbi:MAG TPA: hypothetical protein VLV76_26385 [Candidatus Acidoferrum sp.]|nr:hypothetical protein [Candidatus Acidoferrum sp.]
MDDYNNFEKPLVGRYGVVRMLIAFCGIVGVGVALMGGFSLGSSALATGGAVLALICVGLFMLTRFYE